MHNQQILSKLKPWVNNNRQWQAFSDYIDALIEQQHKALEQSDDSVLMYRSQGAVATLRKLKNASGRGKWNLSLDEAEATGLSEEHVKRKYPFSFGQLNLQRELLKRAWPKHLTWVRMLLLLLVQLRLLQKLPEDAELIKELIAAGYEEGDIKKMGMGGAYTALTVAGLLPGVKVAADIAKKGIKEG